MAKGVGLRLLSRRGSWVQIPPSAPKRICWFSFLLISVIIIVGVDAFLFSTYYFATPPCSEALKYSIHA
jgi:hypothetical protein